MSSTDDATTDDDRVAELEARLQALETQVGETNDQGTTTRRKYIKGIGAGAVGGLLAGSGSAAAQAANPTSASVGAIHGGVHQWAQNGYMGPDAAKGNVTPAEEHVYIAVDTSPATWYYGDGSAWQTLDFGGGGGSSTVTASDLDATNSPNDNQLPSYDASSGGFTWVNDQTASGASGDVYDVAPNAVLLVGGGYGSPASGLLSTMQSEYDNNNTCFFRVVGHWTASGNFQYSSSNGTPTYTSPDGVDKDLPVVMDFRGATINYTGTGYALTDDSRPNTTGGSNLQGGHTEIYGGTWLSDGTPTGVWLSRDAANAEIHLNKAYNYQSGGSAAVIECRSEETWIEHNHISVHYGRFCDRLVYYNDTGGASTSSGNNVSFQDTTLGRSKLDRVTNGGVMYDLNGNFVDCTIRDPTVILGSNSSAMFNFNANMAGTTIIRPSCEQGGGTYTNAAMVKLGGDGRQGPIQFGGGPGADGTQWFNRTSEGASWNWRAWTSDGTASAYGSGVFMINFRPDGNSQVTKWDGGGMKNGSFAANDLESAPVMTQQFYGQNGDITIEGTLTESGTVND